MRRPLARNSSAMGRKGYSSRWLDEQFVQLESTLPRVSAALGGRARCRGRQVEEVRELPTLLKAVGATALEFIYLALPVT